MYIHTYAPNTMHAYAVSATIHKVKKQPKSDETEVTGQGTRVPLVSITHVSQCPR